MTTAVRPGPLIRESFNRPYGHFRFWRLRHAEATMSLYRGRAEESVCVQTDANDEADIGSQRLEAINRLSHSPLRRNVLGFET